MFINVNLLQTTFLKFARVLTYSRGDVHVSVHGVVTYRAVGTDSDIVNDYDQGELTITLLVSELTTLGVYPPKKYDKVKVNLVDRNVELEKVNYAGEIPVFVRLGTIG